jgi:3-oxoacyl-[acyl-carrier-protein] synthase-1
LAKARLLTEKNSNGFSPGEAGSAVLVGSHRPGREDLVIHGIGMAREQATSESEEPLRGEDLSSAIEQALRQASQKIEELQYRISDLNGEHYKFKEMVFAIMRHERERRQQLFELWHPIEYIAEVGAAIGPLILGLALDAGRKRYAPGRNVLCTFSNDDGERAAIVASVH